MVYATTCARVCVWEYVWPYFYLVYVIFLNNKKQSYFCLFYLVYFISLNNENIVLFLANILVILFLNIEKVFTLGFKRFTPKTHPTTTFLNFTSSSGFLWCQGRHSSKEKVLICEADNSMSYSRPTGIRPVQWLIQTWHFQRARSLEEHTQPCDP